MENNHLLGSITTFFILAFVAATTLFIALILWLAETIHSLPLAMTMVGCFALFLSLIIYFAAVRPSVKRLEHQITKINEVAELIHLAYNWVVKMIGAILK